MLMLNFAEKKLIMRYFILLAFLSITLLFHSCRHDKTLFGTWVADNINVEFDENSSSPELVRQMGKMEKDNRILLSADSTLQFFGSQENLKGRFQVKNDTLFCNEKTFGFLKDTHIVREEKTILGTITISYKKE